MLHYIDFITLSRYNKEEKRNFKKALKKGRLNKMKNQRGMGHIMLVIWIIVIIVIAVGAISLFGKLLNNQIVETYKTDMLLIQGKVRVLSEEAVVNKNEELLVGKKITDCLEIGEIKTLLEKGIISEEEEDFDNYYVLEKANLEEMELHTIRLEKGYYIVNYNTDEIIYSEGIKEGKNTYYKLSELEQLNQNEENNQESNEIVEGKI